MKTFQFLIGLFIACFVVSKSSAQVVSVTPAYPTVEDTVTIVYNAALGNGALNGVGPVYIHVGVISQRSVNLADWQFKKRPFHLPDSTLLMQNIGPNLWEIKFRVRTFLGFPVNEQVRALAMVFRNFAGTQVGKNADGSDIHVPVYGQGYSARMISPLERPLLTFSTNQMINVSISANQPSFINVFRDNVLVAQSASTQLLNTSFPSAQFGKFWIKFTAQSGTQTIVDSMYYVVQPPVTIQDPPAGTRLGINYLSNSSVILCLIAPQKSFSYAIGDFNDWQIEPNYLMNRALDGERYWIQLDNLTPNQEVRFQYLVDNDVRTADPFCEKILEPFNDAGINPSIYPNLIPYPTGKTTEIVSVMHPGKPAYQWQNTTWNRPDSRDLVFYELLIRDFAARNTYKTVRDSLGYLKKLGVNAIKLMPVMEFDGNNSWGYGPNFMLAADKVYGPSNELKALIDAAHGEGMVVVLDIVLNHVFGQSPLLRLWQDRETRKPLPNNPYCNVEPMHPFNVGTDLNHDSPYVRDYCDITLNYWLSEYKADGYRFDLSKGFTQTNSGDNIGMWSSYDAGRVFNIQRMVNKMWQDFPGTYAILEHFAANDEETELANFGCMMWGKATTQYNQATMGWPNDWDFTWQMSYQARGWAFHNLIGFMESHDEERLMYNNLNYGNVAGGYSTKTLPNALQRMGAAAALFFTIPGPKMMWMFGEYGFDYSINWPTLTEDSRTSPKPVRWDYLMDANRHRLFKTYAALIKLKVNNPAFRTSNYSISAWGVQKQVYVTDPSMNCIAIANFGMTNQDVFTGFQHPGTWYDYFTGQPLNVTDVNMTIPLPPGHFRVYTNTQLPAPDMSIPDSVLFASTPHYDDPASFNTFVAPNPFSDRVNFTYYVSEPGVVNITIFDMLGREVRTLSNDFHAQGTHQLVWDGITNQGVKASKGNYFYRITSSGYSDSGKLVLMD
jgi:1,4-alpha-glucan branching enzyme